MVNYCGDNLNWYNKIDRGIGFENWLISFDIYNFIAISLFNYCTGDEIPL